MLVVAKSDKLDGKVLNYDGQAMFYSEPYGGYAYLVITAGGLDADEAAAKVASAEGTATDVEYDFDVNKTGKVDMNDAQLAYDIYLVKHQEFNSDITMEKFLRADMNTDHKVDTGDTTAIVAEVRK